MEFKYFHFIITVTKEIKVGGEIKGTHWKGRQ